MGDAAQTGNLIDTRGVIHGGTFRHPLRRDSKHRQRNESERPALGHGLF
jgi:hypothetical protein